VTLVTDTSSWTKWSEMSLCTRNLIIVWFEA